MLRRHTLTAKLVSVGSAMLVLALASIGLTLWVTWRLEGGAAAVNEAGRMRMQTWRLASAVQAADEPASVASLIHRFDDSLRDLREGDPHRPLFVPWTDEVRASFARVEALWSQRRDDWLAPHGVPASRVRADAGAFVEAVDELVTAIEHQMAQLTAILNLFQFLMMALAVGGAVVMMYTGYLYVINPLARLQRGLQRVESADFTTRIEVDTRDEFAQVAAGFNRMAATLQSLYAGLEARVEAKTRRIDAQRARLEALYEISAFLSRADAVDDLAPGFAQRIRAVARADAAVIRWSDEARQRYLMLSADAFPGPLAQTERSLAVGTCACGSLTVHSRTRVIPIAPLCKGGDPTACAREGFTHVISVPVRLQHRILGEISLFYRGDVHLSQEEVDLLDALASHLASAVEGLRADALEREAAVCDERALLARELHDSIAQSLAFLKIQAQMLRQAIQRGQAERIGAVMDELDAGLKECTSDVRELLVHFRTRTHMGDIETALTETLHKFEHQTGLPATLEVSGDGLPLPADVQVQVLHIVQEALSNVRKHAGATHARIEWVKGPRARVTVRDDGRGFDPSLRPDETHVGLKIMRERARRIGASVELRSTPGVGTTVTLCLPGQAQRQVDGLQPPERLIA